MKIKKEDLKVLENVAYNSSNYYIDEEIYEYDRVNSETEFNFVMYKINSVIDSYLIVDGYSKTWDGHRDIKSGYADSIEVIIQRMNVDEIEIEFNKDEKAIVLRGSHHDGINIYYVRKPEWFSVKELKEILEILLDESCFYSKEEVNEVLKNYYDKTLSNVSKSDLIDVLRTESLLEDYN
jgi:hypothetical protein